MKKSIVAILVGLASLPVAAANYSVDARIDAMGGAGTAAASSLTAAFHNPALVALEPDTGFGILFPVIGIEVRDPDDLVSSLEDFSGIFDDLDNNTTSANRTTTANALRNLQGKNAFLNGGAGLAITIPTSQISGSFFAKGYGEGSVLPNIVDSDISQIEDESNTTFSLDSEADIAAFGVYDVGLALATNLNLLGQRVAVGVSPKIQKLYTYHYNVSVTDFNVDDWDDDRYRREESTFNLDLGAAWVSGPLRVGFAAKNVVSQEIKTYDNIYTYRLDPLYTIGTAFVTDMVTIAADIDLNKQKRFSGGPVAINDETQYARVGAEFNALGWAQLRAGYMKDMEDNMDGAATFGVGLSPFGVFHLDLAASVIDSNSYGGSLQMAFTL